METTTARFWTTDLDERPNLTDLREMIDEGTLVGIVGEDAGGIVAYAHYARAEEIAIRLAEGSA